MENQRINAIKDEICERVGQKRYAHILRVVDMAKKLAIKHRVDLEKAKLSALLHDCAKTKELDEVFSLATKYDYMIPDTLLEFPAVIHAHLGSHIAKVDYGIEDEDILNAIKYHTTGRKGMSDLEKIIYLADSLEEGRYFVGVERIREASFIDLNKGLYLSVENTLGFLLSNKSKIAIETIELWNERN